MAVFTSAHAAHSRLEYDGGPPDPATWVGLILYWANAVPMQKNVYAKNE